MRLALIGCGAIAAKHVTEVVADGAAQIDWLCDVRREAADGINRQFGLSAKFAQEFAAIPLVEIDGLLICSPTADHHAQVAAALKAGKHVLCEKPLAASSSQIRELLALRDASKSVLAVAFQRRTESPYVTVRNLLQSRPEEFGKLRTMHLFVCERWAQTIDGTWRNDPKLGFGYFGDAGVHQIDSLAFMTGFSPQRVQARGDRRGKNVEVATDVRSLWRDAAGNEVPLTAQFVGDAHHWREDISLHFEKADILLRSYEIVICRENRCDTLRDVAPASSPIADFLATCRGEQQTVAPGESGLVSTLWTEGVLASIPTGNWIEIDKAGVPPLGGRR